MEQEATQVRNPDRSKQWSQAINEKPRPLTNDEKKAAEAAFQQLPFNPEWSDAARKIYEGIADAMTRLQPPFLMGVQEDMEPEAACESVASHG